MLSIEGLTAGYGRADVIRGIDINVPKGRLVCIVGGNGAGKSTTMRTVSGMMQPRSGRIRLNGRDIANLPSHAVAASGLAHVPEGRKVFASLSVTDNLRLGAYSRRDGGRGGATARDLDQVMEMFPRLKERRSQYAGTLSGGEQQMLAIGRALMAAPDVILLDEPSLGLAPKLVEQVFATISRLRDQGRTILLVEQFAMLALQIADYGYLINNGVVSDQGTSKDLLNRKSLFESYIGCAESTGQQ